jgi:hypothetical protein
MHTIFSIILLVLVPPLPAIQLHAGPVAFGVCQPGCAGLLASCYSATTSVLGLMFVADGAPACNNAFLMPTP